MRHLWRTGTPGQMPSIIHPHPHFYARNWLVLALSRVWPPPPLPVPTPALYNLGRCCRFGLVARPSARHASILFFCFLFLLLGSCWLLGSPPCEATPFHFRRLNQDEKKSLPARLLSGKNRTTFVRLSFCSRAAQRPRFPDPPKKHEAVKEKRWLMRRFRQDRPGNPSRLTHSSLSLFLSLSRARVPRRLICRSPSRENKSLT